MNIYQSLKKEKLRKRVDRVRRYLFIEKEVFIMLEYKT